jgi:hypothetical protein
LPIFTHFLISEEFEIFLFEKQAKTLEAAFAL